LLLGFSVCVGDVALPCFSAGAASGVVCSVVAVSVDTSELGKKRFIKKNKPTTIANTSKNLENGVKRINNLIND
jgi:hypothetical protein